MKVRIGINGFGRIGKLVFKMLQSNPHIEVVHINDKMDIALMQYLLKYDSTHGRFNATINIENNFLNVNGHKIKVTNHSNPIDIQWQEMGVDYVIECSGKFKNKITLNNHFKEGVKHVILSAPPEDKSIKTVVMGVNNQTILSTDAIISNASCTTNCAAVLLHVLCHEFNLEKAFMNTVHPCTNNQNLQDGFHTDYRRARSALNNIIPTTTSAVDTIKYIIPELVNRFDGFATRVPVVDCSFVEITALLKKKVSKEDINNTFLNYAQNQLNGYLEYTADPIVSSDITNNINSAVFDSLSTKILGSDFIQIIGWYDNESGYSARIIDLIKFLAK